MKRLTLFLFCFISVFTLFSQLVDEEGMPIVYLRGNFSQSQWGTDEKYRFNRSGNHYYLDISSENPLPADSQFKIGDEEWNFDFGAPESKTYVRESSTIEFIHRGQNCYTTGIYEGTISFDYTGEDRLSVNFSIDKTSPDVTDLVSGTLPVFYINVYKDETHQEYENEIIDYDLSHKDYFNEAVYWIEAEGNKNLYGEKLESVGSKESPLPLQIKARGNWTRIGFSKKPFKIKLDKKQNLLALTPQKSKHYALLAHADDTRGYLRNFVSFNLGRRIGLPWSPEMTPVELVINNDYRGIYFLTESVRVGDGRIEIEELDDYETDGNLISGGYIVELDNYDEDNQIRLNEKSCVSGHFLDMLRITWDTPEFYSQIQKRFITDQFEAINNAVGNNDDILWSYLDMDDLARYYLVNEIISQTESFHGSTYLFRNRGEGQKWHFSPLWDAGNAFSGSTDRYFYDCDPFGNTWIPSIRQNTSFNEKMKDTWLWFMSSEFSGIYEDIDAFAEMVSKAAIHDKQRWQNESVPEGGQRVADNSNMGEKKREVKNHLEAKVTWLKSKFGDFTGSLYPEPERDETPAAPLPDYAFNSLSSIDADFLENHDAYLYNLQGLKISNPRKGEIYILRANGISRRIIFR